MQQGMRRICLLLVLSLSTLLSTALANSVLLKQALPEATVIGSCSFRWFGLHPYDPSVRAVRSSFHPGNGPNHFLALYLHFSRPFRGPNSSLALFS